MFQSALRIFFFPGAYSIPCTYLKLKHQWKIEVLPGNKSDFLFPPEEIVFLKGIFRNMLRGEKMGRGLRKKGVAFQMITRFPKMLKEVPGSLTEK